MDRLSKMDELRRGLAVFIGLAVLTLIEYFIGILELETAGVILLAAVALMKGLVVLWFFMHIFRLWRTDEEGHG